MTLFVVIVFHIVLLNIAHLQIYVVTIYFTVSLYHSCDFILYNATLFLVIAPSYFKVWLSIILNVNLPHNYQFYIYSEAETGIYTKQWLEIVKNIIQFSLYTTIQTFGVSKGFILSFSKETVNSWKKKGTDCSFAISIHQRIIKKV